MATPSRPPLLGTFTIVFLAIAALFVCDAFLARMEQSEEQAEAARLFQEGQVLARRGRNTEAAAKFQTALSTAPGTRDYQLALAQALLDAGKLPAAEAALSDLLQHNSTDGAANLALARVLVKEGRISEAISYYHRAIYGQWKESARDNRVRVRFELVDLLAMQNSKEELLAELLPLQESAPDDIQTRERIARLFIAAGSPDRAAQVFRDILRDGPDDPGAYAGLGEAEFARGNYRVAQSNFLMAARLKPADASFRKRADLSGQVLDLDPTRRGLAPGERYQRGAKLLETALDDVKQCIGDNPSQPARELMDASGELLKRRVRFSREDQAFEANLDLAQQLWQLRKKDCKAPVAESEEPLALVIAKVTP